MAAVARARPTELVGYASVVGRLARATLAGELDVRPARVSTNSEPLSAEDRAAIAAAWGARRSTTCGARPRSASRLSAAASGEGLHGVSEDEVVLERVDRDGNPVAPRRAPAVRTLATGLANYTFPFIRYDLGDEVTVLGGECPCGSSLVRVADIAGRRDDDFDYDAHTIPASAFRYVLGTDPRISEYQVRQTRGGAEVLGRRYARRWRCVTAGLCRAALRKHGLPRAEIRVRAVTQIERHAATRASCGALSRCAASSAS